MFKDEITPDPTSARVSSAVHPRGNVESAKPSPLEEEVVSLFDQLRDRLLRYMLGLGLPTPDGEEIVQEVFLALFQHLQRGKPRHNLRAWVFQVVHNLALKQRNLTRSRQSLLERGGTSSENYLVDRVPNPEEQFARNQRRVRILGVWQALPEQDRQCLALRAESLTYREISKVLDISLGYVSLSLARSLARFARADER
jgi:RNA polymerase sigma-70 factor (ECF subfamily)